MVKIERTFPAPASLAREAEKANGSYREPDVIRQLCQDFHNKCYICEIGDLQDPQVEHLLPHHNGRYPERKYDWNNLFLSCEHCNLVKNQRKYDAGIIDCCKDAPEELIRFRFYDEEPYISAQDEANA
ncbi:MAG: HNH endonuclease [Lachnospiraceae bacterium]|nr:HNH endonuclease [Lachnospiraceae bacterium]